MEDTNHDHASRPRRLVAQSPPSVLIVEQEPDLREFLRVSLQRWYQVAVASDGAEAVQHLEHCPPRGLVVGQITAQGEEELLAALQKGEQAVPILKLWSRHPPAGWADLALRHPFMRIDLLRAMDRLIHTEAEEEQEGPSNVKSSLGSVEIEADTDS